MATKAFNPLRLFGFAVLASAALLAACGGSSSGPAATTLGGTAAVGAPIVGGTVTVSCASGSGLTTTTSSTGGWTVTISGQTLPCASQVSGGTISGATNTTPYHSIAVSFGTLNITPLTNLVVAQLVGADPATWFGTPVFTSVNSAALNTALSTVNTSLGLTSTLGSTNPLTTAFAPNNGVLLDDVLEAIAATLANGAVNKTYAQLLAAAAAQDYSTFTGFGTTFGTIYVSIAPSTGGGTTVGGGSPGTLTVATTVAGFTTSINVSGVTAPTSQTSFCDNIVTDNSLTSLSAAGGSLTIDSCTFSGNVGNIGATLRITTPISLITPYSIRYTYN